MPKTNTTTQPLAQKVTDMTASPSGHAAPTATSDDAGIDDLLRLISSSSVEHMQHDLGLAGGTAKSSGNLQCQNGHGKIPAQQMLMPAAISHAFSGTLTKSVDSSLLTPSSPGNLDLLLKEPASPFDGFSSKMALHGGLFPACPESTSSSLSVSPASTSPAPPLIQLPKVVANATSAPFSGGLLDLGTSSATVTGGICSTSTTSSGSGITADEFYAQILDSMLDQSKFIETAYKRNEAIEKAYEQNDEKAYAENEYEQNEAYEQGISWRELLKTNMELHPLVTITDFARNAGRITTAIVPRKHYLPILLECARVWRHAVGETIDRRLKRDGKDIEYSHWEDRSDYSNANDGGRSKYKWAQHIIPPADRRLLAQLAGRIVQRHLALHDVFSSTFDGDNQETHAWDDFSETSAIESAHFLDFVCNEFLRPALHMGWKGLICENIEAWSSSESRMMSNLLGPVVSALQRILVETKGRPSVCVGFDPDHTNHVLDWTEKNRSMLFQLGDAGTILKAKLTSLVRVTSKFIVQGDGDEKGVAPTNPEGPSQLYGRGYTRNEAKIILDDCINDWTSLAEQRRSALVKASRANVANNLATAAHQIVLCHKRLYSASDDAASSDNMHRLVRLIHNKFLSRKLRLDLPSLATNTQAFGDKSLACHLIEGIEGMYSEESSSPYHAIKIARSVNYNLRLVGICPFTCDLRVKLEGLEKCRLGDLEPDQARQLHQSCVALWKSAAVTYSARGQCNEHDGDETELIDLAGRLIIQHQRIQKMYSSGVEFSLSSVIETCSVLDFAYDNFLCYGAECGIDFARMREVTAMKATSSESTSDSESTSEKKFTNFENGPYEIIIGALQHLSKMDKGEVATNYYYKFCSAGTEDGEHKAYLDAELPFINGLWPHSSAPATASWYKCPQGVRSLIRTM